MSITASTLSKLNPRKCMGSIVVTATLPKSPTVASAAGEEVKGKTHIIIFQIPPEQFPCIEKSHLFNVAFIRYLSVALIGCSDGAIYSFSKSQGWELVNPESELIADTNYHFVPSPSSGNFAPIYFKDFFTNSSSIAKGSRRPIIQDVESRMHSRDSARSQVSGDTATAPYDFDICHAIPSMRGDAIFSGYITKYRGVARASTPTSNGINGTRNLVLLTKKEHAAWDNGRLFLFPLPNIAYSETGAPLPYKDNNIVMSSPSPNGPFPKPENPWFNLCGTLEVPFLWQVKLHDQALGYDRPQRLQGPMYKEVEEWPAEHIWTYRFASRLCNNIGGWGSEIFRQWSKNWTKQLANIFDGRGDGSFTTQSFEYNEDCDGEGGSDRDNENDYDDSPDDPQEEENQSQDTPKTNRITRSSGRKSRDTKQKTMKSGSNSQEEFFIAVLAEQANRTKSIIDWQRKINPYISSNSPSRPSSPGGGKENCI